jgi:hypothetical protein
MRLGNRGFDKPALKGAKRLHVPGPEDPIHFLFYLPAI